MRNKLSILGLAATLAIGCGSTRSTQPLNRSKERAAPVASAATGRTGPRPPAARLTRAAAGPALSAKADDRYIVPKAHAAKYYVGHYQAAAAYFTPSVAQVVAFEVALSGFLKQTAEGAAIVAKLGSYRRHYVGTIIGGKRLVFGNFFCAAFGKGARHVVMVDDGGNCFFNVYYDGARGAFSKLFINGDG